MQYRGKDVVPVNYDYYLQEAQEFKPCGRLKGARSPLFYSRSFKEQPSVFPTIPKGLRLASATAWVKGKNEFDRQLRTLRRHQSMLENRRNVDKLRHALRTADATLTCDDIQKAQNSTIALLSTRSDSVIATPASPQFFTSANNAETSALSSPQRVNLLNTTGTAGDSQPCRFIRYSNTNGSLFSEDDNSPSALPSFRVRHRCLLVNNSNNRLTERVYIDQFSSQGLPSKISMGNENSLTQTMGKRCGTRHLDEKLLTLLRASDVHSLLES